MFVYVWKHNDTPFYVGLSKTERRSNPLNVGGRGWLCKQTLAKIGPKNVVVELHIVDTVEEAQLLERSLIEKYGRIQLETGPLTNLRAGGDGAKGMSNAGRLATSKRMTENNPMKNPTTRAKATARMNDPDVKAKFMGDNNPAKRPEVQAKLLAKWQEPEYKAKQRQARLGIKRFTEKQKEERRKTLLNPEHPLTKMAFHNVLNTDSEINKKRSAGVKAWWAKRKSLIQDLP
jgi:hypothetical protein